MTNVGTCGIVGNGFIGRTLYKAFTKANLDVKQYDINPELSKNPLEEVANCKYVFICVPTPMNLDTGECFTGIVEKACTSVRQHSKDSILVIKSTIPPGTTYRLNLHFGKVLFCPEFLTEANPYEDFVNSNSHMVGFSTEDTRKYAESLINDVFVKMYTQGVIVSSQTYCVFSTHAEMCKYMRNTYLATRLSYFTEMKQICDKLDIDFDITKFLAGLDERVGNHYNRIDEEEPEYSGSCLPKDINGLICFAEKMGVDPKVLKASWAKNLEVAKKKTWESLPGRAFIKE